MVSFSMGPCARRAKSLEYIDTPEITDDELTSAFQFIESTEKLTGSYRHVLNFLRSCSKNWTSRQTITILDMFCGRGPLAVQILKWAEARNLDIHVLAVDRYGRFIDLAKERSGRKRKLSFDVRDWKHPSFLQAQQFDYVVSLSALHHLPIDQVVPFLKKMDLLARYGLFMMDWVRDFRAWLWMKSMTSLLKEDIVRHDGPMSIRRSFTMDEMSGLLREAHLEHLVLKKHLGFRFSISGERRFVMSPKMSPSPGLAGT